MSRRPRIRVAALDAWRLASEAITAGCLEQARTWADVAVDRSGWECYAQGFTYGTQAIFYWPLEAEVIPATWAYFAAADGAERLLVHQSVALFVAQIRSLQVLFAAATGHGGGLVALDELMTDVFLQAITPPDDASALAGSRVAP